MVPCAESLARLSPHVFRITSFSRAKSSSFSQQTRIPACPVWINGFRTCSSCKVSSFALYLAVSDGGGGGRGGYSGSNDGNFGGGGDDARGGSSGNNWTLLSWYLSLLEKYRAITKAVTSAFFTFLGDVICQRNFLFTFPGLGLVGPTLPFWYLYLRQLVTVSGALGAFKRLILDQIFPIYLGDARRKAF